MQGYHNHKQTFKGLKVSSILKAYVHNAKLYHFEAGYPGLYKSDNVHHRVFGEWIEFGSTDDVEQALYRTDCLEEYFGPGDPRNLYERESIQVHFQDSSAPKLGWIYVCRADPPRDNQTLPNPANWSEFMELHQLAEAKEDWSEAQAMAMKQQ